jgi:chromate transporter
MEKHDGSDARALPQFLPDPGACEIAAVTASGGLTDSKWLLCKIFAKIGATAFGGIGPSLAIIERELVQKHKLLTTEDIALAWAAAKLLPGSSVVQVVAFVGYRLAGWSGSALATCAYLFPSVVAMVFLAAFYDYVSALPAFGLAARGLTAALIGLLLSTMCRLGRGTFGNPLTLAIAVCAFGSVAVPALPSAAVVLAAGLIGVLLLSVRATELTSDEAHQDSRLAKGAGP